LELLLSHFIIITGITKSKHSIKVKEGAWGRLLTITNDPFPDLGDL
jgi:hypothetical protein